MYTPEDELYKPSLRRIQPRDAFNSAVNPALAPEFGTKRIRQQGNTSIYDQPVVQGVEVFPIEGMQNAPARMPIKRIVAPNISTIAPQSERDFSSVAPQDGFDKGMTKNDSALYRIAKPPEQVEPKPQLIGSPPPVVPMREPSPSNNHITRIRAPQPTQVAQQAGFDKAPMTAPSSTSHTLPRIVRPPISESVEMPNAPMTPAPAAAPIAQPSAYEVSQYPEPPRPDHRLDKPRGFWGKVKHILEHAGKGFVGGLEASGGNPMMALADAIAGGIKPELADNLEHNVFTIPRWKKQQAEELELEDRKQTGLERVARIRKIDFDRQSDIENQNRLRENDALNREDRLRGLTRQEREDREQAARNAVEVARKYKQPVPMDSVKGTSFESFAGAVPPDEPAEYGFDKDNSGNPYFYDKKNRSIFAPKEMPSGYERKPDPDEKPLTLSEKRSEASRQAKARVLMENPDWKILKNTNDYARDLYKRYAAEAGISENKLRKVENNPEEFKEMRERLKEIRQKAETDAKTSIERKLKELEAKYEEEALSSFGNYNPRTALRWEVKQQ